MRQILNLHRKCKIEKTKNVVLVQNHFWRGPRLSKCKIFEIFGDSEFGAPEKIFCIARNYGTFLQIRLIHCHQSIILLPISEQTRTTNLCDDFEQPWEVSYCCEGQKTAFFLTIRKKWFFSCNQGRKSLLCKNGHLVALWNL